jgi:hypothetical protein
LSIRRLHVLAERHAALADESRERRDDGDVGDSLFGERELCPGLSQGRTRRSDVLHRRFCSGARLICDRRRDVASGEQRRVSLRRRLRQGVLRLGQPEVCFGTCHGGARLVLPQTGIDALQADQHGPLFHELPDVYRRGDDPPGRLRRHVR